MIHTYLIIFITIMLIAGCANPGKRLKEADRAAKRIIAEKQMEALGRNEPFTITPASETLRGRLFIDQDLACSTPASKGSQYLEPISLWPDIDYPDKQKDGLSHRFLWHDDSPQGLATDDQTLKLTLIDALQIGAANSRDYQAQKENIFRAALDLDLERNEFRHTLTGLLESVTSTDLGTDPTLSGVENSVSIDWNRRFTSGLELTTRIGLDLVKLLTLDKSSSFGLFGDATISIPLLRGAGRHIVSEPLTQAEREVVYAIYRFERFKRIFAVQVSSEYLTVLQQLDEVANTEDNYRRLDASAERAARLAEAGRLPEIQVDQTIQDALRARDRWLKADQSYGRRLDGFKIRLGLPPDARMELDRTELSGLTETTGQSVTTQNSSLSETDHYQADFLELDEIQAVRTALTERLDLRIAQGDVYDRQRAVVVKADGLRPELTLLGSADMGENRNISSSGLPNAGLRPEHGYFSMLLHLDWPFNKTKERNELKKSLIDLEQAVRDMQEIEDQIKLQVRNRLRDLYEFRERINIQAKAVIVAQRRVDSTTLFLEAGRVQMRDLLEAREALVQSRNNLTAAQVNYRVAELELQRDMGVLQVDHKGLYHED